MTRTKLLSILQEETDGFKEQSRLRDDVLDAMEQAYIKGKNEQLTLTDVVSTYHCESYDFKRQGGRCAKQCDSCEWMEKKQ